MNTVTARALLALNRRFYRRFAEGFGASRHAPWSGWHGVTRCLAEHGGSDEQSLTVLDLGCGNARFAHFLAEHILLAEHGPEAGAGLRYIGLDGNRDLLDQARKDLAGPIEAGLIEAELIEAELGEHPVAELDTVLGSARRFGLVVLFGVLHHVPGEALRLRWLEAAARRLAPGGVLAVSVWRLDRQPRFERKLLGWDEHNQRARARGEEPIDLDQLEPGDHLLTWSRERDHPRYCHFPPDDELERWIDHLATLPHPLRLIERYEGDGRGDRDNLYLVWKG